ncbi:RWD domain-containing protein 2A isoform X3 [Accipiter gentilis]|uniref:RWD domain-containing protein 2A isoform X3 n=1 Tax=Astur gentilis TaxID=8957 RepID=UPI00210FBBE6|nr:RWD domain-containing protein 2A isoform X3 [Accipiter gentilis]
MVQQKERSGQRKSRRSNSRLQDVAILIASPHNLPLTGKKSLACLSVAAELIFFLCVCVCSLFKVKVELQVLLPHMYPHVAPQLFARSNALHRQQQLQLNTGLASHISSLDSGELCICGAVQWVKDHSLPYLENSKISSEGTSKEVVVKETLHRMWIYSHHIYRQELRKKIFDCARKLNLTGFCLTGKPGVICVEGLRENCEEFWRLIRYPNWKHISCKHVENIETEGSIDNLRLFRAFEDLQFQAHGDYGLRNDYHMDLGQFLEFLKQHQSGHIFQILFGVEGKLSDK